MDLFESSNDIFLLDGGLSNDLNNRVNFDVHSEPLWTAKALHSQPDSVIATHMAYLKAGADIIETASYQATLEGFKDFLSLNAEESKKLISDSVSLVKVAVKDFLRTEVPNERKLPLLVAGSLGPYGVYLRNGSEYTGSYIPSISTLELENMHLPRILSLIDGGADIIAIETMPAIKEVEVILDLVKKHAPNVKAWVSFSIKENDPTHTAFGDNMEDAYNTVSRYPQAIGFGINCCKPTDITPFLKHVNRFEKRKNDATNKLKIIVYPNSGQQWIAGQGWIAEEVPILDSYLKDWVEHGANIIGGCCQVGPDQIEKMRKSVNSLNLERKVTTIS